MGAIFEIATGQATGAIIDIAKFMSDFTYPNCADWY
jgi:hypothetical protein